VSHRLAPATLTTDEQRLILRATAGNVRDHVIFSLALGTGLRLDQPCLVAPISLAPCTRHLLSLIRW
jgi:integrase